MSKSTPTPIVVRAEREAGPIDVLVNSAVYGHEGIFEESSLDDMRRQFDASRPKRPSAMVKSVVRQ